MKQIVPVACLLLAVAAPAQERLGKGDVELTVSGEAQVGGEIGLVLKGTGVEAFALLAALELGEGTEDLGAEAALLHLSTEPLRDGFSLPLRIPDHAALVGVTVHLQAIVATEGALGRSDLVEVTVGEAEPQIAFASTNPNYVNEDGGWKDVDTGLVWNATYHGFGNWDPVKEVVEDLDDSGFDDWRLPTLAECLDAVSKGIADCFVEPTWTWTSSTKGKRAEIVNMVTGEHFLDWKNGWHAAHPVRGGSGGGGGGGRGGRGGGGND